MRIQAGPLLALVAGWAWGLGVSPASAGPNSGGTLVVHDAGIGYTSSLSAYPSDPPASCGLVDAEIPNSIPAGFEGRVWKVYAAFPPLSTPRLKALAFAESFAAPVVVLAGGLPDPALDFEITQNGWPTTSGGAAGISFGQVKTSLLAEIYWFAGYVEAEANGVWATAPHPVVASIFVDDSVPPLEDPIAAFSSIGFGLPGVTLCPSAAGACCFEDGSCLLLLSEDCTVAGGVFGLAASCQPNPCPQAGACCLPNGACQLLGVDACASDGGFFLGTSVPCEPYPCALGACCLPSGACMALSGPACDFYGGTYLGNGSVCQPNPCPQPLWACCLPDGSCLLRTTADCEQNLGGTSIEGLAECQPNPCTQVDGACCLFDATCVVATLVECEGLGGRWLYPYATCEPNPCPIVPVIETSWGRIKRQYQ